MEKREMFKSLIAAAALAAATGAMATPSQMSDAQYLAAVRCQALMSSSALGKTDTAGISAVIKAQSGSRMNAVFDRADDVLTVCEMKYSAGPVGIEVISSMKRKIGWLQPVTAGKTIQPVLIVRERPSQALIDQGYFYKIIEARDFLDGVQ